MILKKVDARTEELKSLLFKKGKKVRKLIVSCLIILCGCATLPEKSSEIKPIWITKTLESANGFYFVGISIKSESLDEGRKIAVNDALIRIVQYLGVKVRAHYELMLNTIYTNMKSEIETFQKVKLKVHI